MKTTRIAWLILTLASIISLAACTAPGADPLPSQTPWIITQVVVESPVPQVVLTPTTTTAPLPQPSATSAPQPQPSATSAPQPEPTATSGTVNTSDFCTDTRVAALIDSLADAIHDKDGERLSALVSPTHGLNVELTRMGTLANYTAEEAKWVFKSTYATSWGLHPGSGAEVKGTFSALVAPKLEDVLLSTDTQRVCNKLMVGGASYQASLPDVYTNPTFYSLYRPGSNGDELNWRTWVMVVEYANGQPFITGLHHFEWEP